MKFSGEKLQALRFQIYTARCESQFDHRKFLPNSSLNELVNKQSIEAILNDQPGANFKDSMKTVIAILVYIDKFKSLPDLIEQGLTDEYLPLTFQWEDKVFVSAREDKTFKQFFSDAIECEKFEESQWVFLSPIFDDSDVSFHEFDKKRLLPIIWCSTESWGGSFGEVKQVKIHHSHLVGDIESTQTKEPLMALKQLKSNSQQLFEREEIALRRIQSLRHDHLIKVIASFKRGPVYFFLFPWAKGGDLRKMWTDQSDKDRSPEMIKWIFEQIKGIASGIRRLHKLSDDAKDEENFRHGDLRPENILLFLDTPGSWRGALRITDVGLAKLHSEITSKRVIGTVPMGGLQEYAPPDTGKKQISRKYDIWSAGCIFLEFVVWIVGGIKEVEKFHKARHNNQSPYSEYFCTEVSRKQERHIKNHPEVHRYIKALRKDNRCKSAAGFLDLLNLIEKNLLQTDEKLRFNAEGMDDSLGEIFQKTERNKSYLLGDSNAIKGFKPSPLSLGSWPF